jgi:sec-independent protein translocase protein TatA
MIINVPVIGSLLGIFGLPGGGEWIVLLILGLLIFGRRLPEVGRSIGKSIVEFKRGIKGIEDEIDDESTRSPARLEGTADRAKIASTPAAEEPVNPYPQVEQTGREA